MRHAARRPPSNGNFEESSVQRKFKQLLHQYKLEVFHAQHDRKSVEEISTECLHMTEDVLKQKYHYHFHKLPDADRAEIINMINDYTREAILPPVVEKLVHRQVLLEKKLGALQHLTEQILEALSAESDAERVGS
jgi:hypothetical protein